MAFARVGDTQKMLEWYNKMKEDNISPDSVLVASIINAFATKGDVMSMEHFFDKVKEEGVKYERGMYENLMLGYIEAKKYSEVPKVFERMKRDGFTPSDRSRGYLLGALGKSGDIHEMMKQLNVLLEDPTWTPSIMVWNGMLDAVGKHGNLDVAFHLFDRMQKYSPPNELTFNVMISILGKKKKFPEMVSMYKRMDRFKVQPSGYTYNIILSNFVNENDIKHTEQWITVMKRNKIQFRIDTYNIILGLYKKNNDMVKFKEIWREMKQNNIRPDAFTYKLIAPSINSMVEIIGAEQIEEMIRDFEKDRRKFIKPNQQRKGNNVDVS